MSGRAEGRKIILVVEDEEVLREAVADGLRERFEVYQASDGIQAMELLATQRVDLVLTDLHMPRLDGLRLMQAIQETWPKTKVVLCTRNPGRELLQRIEALKVDPLITKPYSLEEVIRVIECLLGERADR